MADELAAEGLPLEVRILGVNAAGQQAGNASVCLGRSLPWLQDEAAVGAWQLWGVTTGDLVILDETNTKRAVHNTIVPGLEVVWSYEEVKQTLRTLAGG